MANDEHLAILHEGVEKWNEWRETNAKIRPDLSGANLYGARLSSANLKAVDLHGAILCTANLAYADLSEADLSECSLCCSYLKKTNLRNADLSGADLFSADFRWADLQEANLSNVNVKGKKLRIADLPGIAFINLHLGVTNLFGANLTSADIPKASFVCSNLSKTTFTGANLSEANFSGAQIIQTELQAANLSNAIFERANLASSNLNSADLSNARLVNTNLSYSNLENCRVYGVSTWDVSLHRANQLNLVITRQDQATITVDNIEVAQFIYLMLNNIKIRDIIDTLTAKTVLILGRFTPTRKTFLDAIRLELRKRNYLPIVFDFDKPANRDITETVSVLAHMSRFVVADITEARSIPQELKAIIPNLPSVPVQPLLQVSIDQEYSMFEHFTRFPWVLPVYQYDDDSRIEKVVDEIVHTAERKIKKLITSKQ